MKRVTITNAFNNIFARFVGELFKMINIIIVKIILKGFYFRLLQRTGKVINNINSFGK